MDVKDAVDSNKKCAVSAEGRFEAFDVASRWLVDTGCGHDLLSLKTVGHLRHAYEKADDVTFSTANGMCQT